MSFLNESAIAIQAVSACVTAVATLVLAVITWRYLKVTRRLASAAEREWLVQERSIRSLANELLITAISLPPFKSGAENMRLLSLWDAEDIRRLRELSSVLGEEQAKAASKAAESLRWLRDAVTAVQETPEEKGVRWDQWPWELYLAHRLNAITFLAGILGIPEEKINLFRKRSLS